jgi:hypothetical protein
LRKLVNDCQQRRRTARPGTAGWVVADIHHAGRLQAELTTLAQGDAALDPGSRHYGQRRRPHRLPALAQRRTYGSVHALRLRLRDEPLGA